MINDLVIKQFNDKKINSLIWKENVCWEGASIAELFGYNKARRAIYDCIQRESLQEGHDYEILTGEDLKAFKEVFLDVLADLKFAPKIVILYESGLYRFLAYTKMPLGIEFREWIGNDLMPTLRKKGYYTMDGVELPTKISEKKEFVESDSGYSKFSTEKMERYRMALETAKMFQPILDNITKDSIYKFLYLKQIFVDAGIELPKFIYEELL